MYPFLKTFVVGVVLTPLLDFLWIGLIAREFYLKHLKPRHAQRLELDPQSR